MKIDFENILKAVARHFSKERVLIHAVFAFFVLFLLLLVLDTVIFLHYYQIAVEPARPLGTGQVGISQSKLEKVLEIVQKREAAP